MMPRFLVEDTYWIGWESILRIGRVGREFKSGAEPIIIALVLAALSFRLLAVAQKEIRSKSAWIQLTAVSSSERGKER